MRLEPLMPLWASLPLFALMALLCTVLLVRRPRQRLAWARRLLMVVLLLAVALRPVTPIAGEQTERMNANVFFVVDRTGSMNAEDYAGDQPRLDGVRADMDRIMGMTEGARYSIIAFDSTATQQLPLTTDAGAARAWIDTLTTEPTAYSTGSNVDRPLTSLMIEITETQREDPDSSILVYFLSDGENTDDRDSESFAQAAGFIDGGAVLGYGTAEGGPMKVQGGEDHGEYITGPDGQQGISSIDEEQLRTIAEQMEVPYLHRDDPEAPIEGTMEGITLRPIPSESRREAASVEDWYWVASIPLAALLIWELGEMTYRLPRRLDRYDISGASR
ncbi:vWA domain-containing protein [Brachybacterium saurashtrense]|uniref:VWA domain-containing protein n=1 Tax=Brachybacterium saurashtrense TaxID=556288 RepID=A0A345YTE3_9MICO|nr:vWA domain-containing protein [Brachybacterium saurashtrense]AXK47195.1 VWA domain-containing protein [Brachybacterium saurashtrense]RRR22157.1 VWA domain-containing protein [Brachybacterium saurashtrense]